MTGWSPGYGRSLIAFRMPVRVLTPSLVKTWDRWVSTVRMLPNSYSAIWWLV